MSYYLGQIKSKRLSKKRKYLKNHNNHTVITYGIGCGYKLCDSFRREKKCTDW